MQRQQLGGRALMGRRPARAGTSCTLRQMAQWEVGMPQGAAGCT